MTRELAGMCSMRLEDTGDAGEAMAFAFEEFMAALIDSRIWAEAEELRRSGFVPGPPGTRPQDIFARVLYKAAQAAHHSVRFPKGLEQLQADWPFVVHLALAHAMKRHTWRYGGEQIGGFMKIKKWAREQMFIEALESGVAINEACRMIGVSLATGYRIRAAHLVSTR
jgi:hypothetical protein